LPLTEKAVFHLNKLPNHHKDPFDWMLIYKAIEHDLIILTCDGLIVQYLVNSAW
jgi:PIN domain nuclease of toxin-antitoxin system